MQLIKKLSDPRVLFTIGLVYTLLITIALLSPTSDIPKIDIAFLDKFIHVIIHWILSFIWLWYGFSTDKYHISSKTIFVILTICFAYGLAIEASQQWFTQTRTFDLFDLVANVAGSLLGLLSFRMVRKKLVH
jgi:VanZ family protein